MMTFFKNICTLIFLIVIYSDILSEPIHRPFSEMQGGCHHYKIPMQTEFKLWGEKSFYLTASYNKQNRSLISLNTKYVVALFPYSQVTFIVMPAQAFRKKENSFAGLLNIKVNHNGFYKISASDKIWLDIINPVTKTVIRADTFEMQTHCDKIFKVIIVPLKAKVNYALQISSSTSAKTSILITKN